MAKDKFVISNMVDVVGTLDYNQNEEFVVYIELGRGENTAISELKLNDILKSCIGRQIVLKLTDEEDRSNG